MKKVILALALVATTVASASFADTLGSEFMSDKDNANAESSSSSDGSAFFGWDGTSPDYIFDAQTSHDGQTVGPDQWKPPVADNSYNPIQQPKLHGGCKYPKPSDQGILCYNGSGWTPNADRLSFN